MIATGPECPECADDGRSGRIGVRRYSCRTCNSFAQAVQRRALAILREASPEAWERARAAAAEQVYAEHAARYKARHRSTMTGEEATP